MSDDNTPYKKRELDAFFRNMNDRMDKQDATLNRIEIKTCARDDDFLTLKSNHEALRDSVMAKWWATVIIVTTVGGFLAFFIPYSIQVFKKSVEQENQVSIKQGIQQEVSAIEQEYNLNINNVQ